MAADLFAEAPKQRYDPTGEYRLPDGVSDQDLVQALSGNRQRQKNALLVLIRRWDRYDGPNFPLLTRENQPTSRAVGMALAKSHLLTDADADMRRLAMLAAAAIPSASAELIDPVIKGMMQPTVAKAPDAAEAAWRSRMGKNLTNSLGFGSDELSKPGYMFYGIMDAAGLAASRFGQTSSAQFVDALDPILIAKGSEFLGQNHSGAIAAYSKSGKAERLAAQLRNSPDVPYSRAMLGRLLLGIDQVPQSSKEQINELCSSTVNSPMLDALQCSILGYRIGNKDEVDTAVAILRNAAEPNSPNSSLRWSASEALLYFYGHAGEEKLRQLVLNREQAASVAANYICRLGPDAGREVQQAVLELAAASPNDTLLSMANRMCSGPERTMRGRFAP